MNIISPKKSIHHVLAGGSKISDAVHLKYGVDVVPGDFLFERNYNVLKLKNKLQAIKKKYDFIILDSSPSLNDEVLSTILASDMLFVVSTADYPTLSCSMKAAKLAKQRDKPIAGIILNKLKGKYEVGVREIQESTDIPVVAKIRDDNIVQMSLYGRVPATLLSRNSHFTKEINHLSKSLLGHKISFSIWEKIFGRKLKIEEVNREVMRENYYKSFFG
jgi:MinD-like ATPase involved in chromosome partitioning or flagellar assembly